MKAIEIKVKNLPVPKGSLADINNLPQTIKTRKKNFLKAVGLTAENLLKDEARRISTFGNLERSIQHKVLGDLVVIYSDLEYSYIALEDGRKGGNMPPVSAIEAWAVKKGLGAGVGWAVAKKIQKSGTNLYINQAPKRITRTIQVMDRKLDALIQQYLLA